MGADWSGRELEAIKTLGTHFTANGGDCLSGSRALPGGVFLADGAEVEMEGGLSRGRWRRWVATGIMFSVPNSRDVLSIGGSPGTVLNWERVLMSGEFCRQELGVGWCFWHLETMPGCTGQPPPWTATRCQGCQGAEPP